MDVTDRRALIHRFRTHAPMSREQRQRMRMENESDEWWGNKTSEQRALKDLSSERTPQATDSVDDLIMQDIISLKQTHDPPVPHQLETQRQEDSRTRDTHDHTIARSPRARERARKPRRCGPLRATGRAPATLPPYRRQVFGALQDTLLRSS